MEPQLALALARAARNTLIAEEEVVKHRIAECRNLLETLKDELEDTQTKVREAGLQVGGVMEFLEQEDIPIDFGDFTFESNKPHEVASSTVTPPICDYDANSNFDSEENSYCRSDSV